jgi:methylenetetrahydrofolate dehydrogenase (NADP+)/methenyltetrahydrofolate cyclohydrolase
MKLIDGKAIANAVNDETAEYVARLIADHNVTPGLAVVLVGDDPASAVYVNMKARTCAKLGIHSEKIVLPADADQATVIETVERLNNDPAIHGILVQSPPPPQIDERAVIEAINPAKDVDCFHPYNVGRLLIGDKDSFIPCTPFGVLVLLGRSGIETSGKHAVVVGRSNIVGKPMAALLARKGLVGNATVALCHSRTADLAAECRRADILVAAIGRPEMITGDMVKPGAVVIDVGINRVDAPDTKKGYKLVGDVHFESAAEKASWITPVPGGVGPMTIAMLMRNTLDACCRINGLPPAPPVL